MLSSFINTNAPSKESKQSEKKKDLELVTALNQSYREDLDRSRRKEEVRKVHDSLNFKYVCRMLDTITPKL